MPFFPARQGRKRIHCTDQRNLQLADTPPGCDAVDRSRYARRVIAFRSGPAPSAALRLCLIPLSARSMLHKSCRVAAVRSRP
jgi:hypothetical protein